MYFLHCPRGQFRQLFAVLEVSTLGIDHFLLHIEGAFLDFILRELLQIVGKSYLGKYPNGPLGWVVLIPADCVAVVFIIIINIINNNFVIYIPVYIYIYIYIERENKAF